MTDRQWALLAPPLLAPLLPAAGSTDGRRVHRLVRPRRAQDLGPGRGDRQAPDQAKGFVLLHRRWVVERSFAWLTKFRRLVRDYETTTWFTIAATGALPSMVAEPM
jgi:transposase